MRLRVMIWLLPVLAFLACSTTTGPTPDLEATPSWSSVVMVMRYSRAYTFDDAALPRPRAVASKCNLAGLRDDIRDI